MNPQENQSNGSIAELVLRKYQELKENEVEIYPCHVNRASAIGHPCERYLVYCRTHWDQRPKHSWKLQAIFDEGNWQEKIVEDDLKKAGFDIVEQQVAFKIKDQLITGHIDGKLFLPPELIPFETKSMNPYIWDSIHCIEDMLNHKRPWVRHYPSQLQTYLFGHDKEYGIFILKNKSNGLIKVIDVYLDYDFVELLLQKAERVNEHIDKETTPPKIEDAEYCVECAFRHICLPDIINDDIKIITGPATIKLIDEYFELQDLVENSDVPKHQKRIKELKERFKTLFKDKPALVVGEYYVTGKWQKHGDGQYWKFDIAHPVK